MNGKTGHLAGGIESQSTVLFFGPDENCDIPVKSTSSKADQAKVITERLNAKAKMVKTSSTGTRQMRQDQRYGTTKAVRKETAAVPNKPE